MTACFNEASGAVTIAKVASTLRTQITRENPILECELPLRGARFEALVPPVVPAPVFSIRLRAVHIFSLGEYEQAGIITSRHYLHLIGCLSVVQSSTYVLLLSVGYRWGAGPPIFYDHPPGTPAVDPVVQALVLTDTVVGATVTALLLALALQVHKRRGTLDPEKLRTMRG